METVLSSVPRETQEKILAYANLVEAWNHHLNLTGAKSAKEFLDSQIADCLAAAPLMPQDLAWIDVGSGAGLPGIPLALLFPQTSFLLVESLQKRVAFLHRAISLLQLKNVEVRAGRFEELSLTSIPERFSQAEIVSRGTESPEDLLRMAMESPIPWRQWWVFSSEKTHLEFLRLTKNSGISCSRHDYSGKNLTRNGILSCLQRRS